MKVSRRRLALLATAALTVLAGGFGIATAQAAASGCSVTYKITSQWSTGFGADVTVTNLGGAVTGWTLTWTLPGAQKITQSWNATTSQSGTTAKAVNVAWNSQIPAGGSTGFGFIADNALGGATGFAVNGTACTAAA